MKLQLLIPQYNEDESVVKNMLDSLKVQQSVDFNDFEVLIGNDGSDIKLSDDFLKSYPYSIQYFQFEHTSPAGTRQQLFDKATAEYVMFCDADDMFMSVLGLYMIFTYMRKGFDAFVDDFMEEIKDRKTGAHRYFSHTKDLRFVHGKVYRRRHIIDNKIVWREDITCHEDSAYNILAIETAKAVEYCKIPIYLWKWRDTSICRADPLYIPKTYTRMIYSSSYLIKDFIDRNMWDRAKFHVTSLIYNTYYMLNKPLWLDPMNAEYRYKTEKCFKDYFAKHKDLFVRTDPNTRGTIIAGIKHRVMKEGVLLEKFTFDAWIKHIEGLE
jgi:glycosyltransferase involved in cell wall biosynthesis